MPCTYPEMDYDSSCLFDNEVKRVDKTWGYELWFANTSRYCGKLLHINHNKWSSEGRYHYHKMKDETFFVIDGVLRLDYVENGEFKTIKLKKNDSFRVGTQTKHRFTALRPEGCTFIEASTTHRDSDSYRCHYDEKTKEWIE